ncbi:hypothetical protein CDD80_321 [Ophiocordyceps camponoti-rufipedis]|uniref:Uncharacterized protein n=1 Tax=Ophiocordyceps camponoti-rufipedis TaxID=2004952 RepID=A0A2C5XPN8_9HYPO|nr:hypothetical protein CDD80_321 [Ophiocordyceps camponoti-rufipedis]
MAGGSLGGSHCEQLVVFSWIGPVPTSIPTYTPTVRSSPTTPSRAVPAEPCRAVERVDPQCRPPSRRIESSGIKAVSLLRRNIPTCHLECYPRACEVHAVMAVHHCCTTAPRCTRRRCRSGDLSMFRVEPW